METDALIYADKIKQESYSEDEDAKLQGINFLYKHTNNFFFDCSL